MSKTTTHKKTNPAAELNMKILSEYMSKCERTLPVLDLTNKDG